MKITFSDINRRISRLDSKSPNKILNMREAQIYTKDNIFCTENAINSIRNWESLDDNIDSAYIKALNIFEELCLNANSSIIKSSFNILLENIDKVRDQQQLMNSLKYRFSRLKQKITTKINGLHNDVSDNIKNNIANLQNTIKSSPLDNKSNNIGVAKECFDALINKSMIITECDRIIKNYVIISKRFNLDKIVTNINFDSDSYQACYEIAACIDTYNQPFNIKYNTALEMAGYVLDKHFMHYPKNKIVESITDYFIFSGSLNENTLIDAKHIRDISVLFDKTDFDLLSYMDNISIETDAEPSKNIFTSGDFSDYVTEDNMIKDAHNQIDNYIKAGKDLAKDGKKGNPDEHKNKEIKNMINDFRAECIKDKESNSNLTRFKSLINKIFTKSPYQIVNELPNLFNILKLFFIAGSISIHPIVAVVLFITNGLLNIHCTRKQLSKAIKAYKNEISSVKNKIEKSKDNDTKKKYEKYLDELKKDLDKLEAYEKDHYTEEENDERLYNNDEKNDKLDDDDFDDDDLDFDDDDFEEAASIICISDKLESLSEAIIDDTIDGIICDNIFKLDNDSIDAITDFSITVPVILEKETLKEALEKHRNELRKSADLTSDYIRIDCLNENILKLENSRTSYNTSNSIKDTMLYLTCLNEFVKIKNNEYLTEMNFSNTIKLAVNMLKKKAIKFKDKEKQISNNIDVSANNVAKSMEDAMKTGNREAVIRGRMIPSASKCIKMALITGAAWAVNPAIAVIGAIGTFACSKKMKAKERQLVLDDIEIELKMCERYLRQAEDSGDMKKVRQIEITQRNLERQRQRIKYKMLTVYHQRVPEINNNDND
jgi:Sec-independent protein translocase protein TatA